MPNYAFLLEYHGASFSGWQRQQTGQRTVQGALEKALSTLAGVPTSCIGAGRTDAGVHALGQVASSRCGISMDPYELWRALNALLPEDAAVRALARVDDDFHALRNAAGKHYLYRVLGGRVRSPLHQSTHAPAPRALAELDLAAIRSAASHFTGTHDFRSLQAAGSCTPTSVRTLTRVSLRELGDGRLCFDVEGDGFLRHMVRNLIGTLLEVGVGRREPDSIAGLLASRDRSRAGPTAPAKGLTLVQVRYDPPIAWDAGKAETVVLP